MTNDQLLAMCGSVALVPAGAPASLHVQHAGADDLMVRMTHHTGAILTLHAVCLYWMCVSLRMCVADSLHAATIQS